MNYIVVCERWLQNVTDDGIKEKLKILYEVGTKDALQL